MAEGVVTFVLGKLDVLLLSEVKLIRGVDDEIRNLHDQLQWLRAFLEDADAKRRGNKLIKVWVDQTRDVAYDVEDAIDEYLYKILHRTQTSGFQGSLHNCVGRTRQLTALHKLGNRVEGIKRRLETISKNRSEYGIEITQTKGETSLSTLPQEQSKVPPVVEEINVVCFEDGANALKQELFGGDVRRAVITVLGMGGLGKTTLARKVYNSSDVKSYFDCQAWIYVSQNYRPRELLLGMLEETVKPDKKEVARMTEHDMMKKLKKYLKDKRYLLVIDDIWDGAALNSICGSLPDEMKGSRVMLTTRIRDVGLYVDPEGFTYELQCLNDQDSWELFCSKAFRTKTVGGVSSELEKMGREMVGKCHGLPLAIVVLGGLLLRKPRSEIEWRRVLKAIKYELHERGGDGQSVKKILALSYADLPHYLKSCFLYFGLFPEDSEIEADKLVQLWVAEGFIQRQGDQTMEEVAEAYLEELVNRCMIQVARRNPWGTVGSCRIHDLLLDLAISEGKEDKFLTVFGAGGDEAGARSEAGSGSRRLASHGGLTAGTSSSRPLSAPNLRSLFWHRKVVVDEWSFVKDHVTSKLKLLRVLDLKGASITSMPKQIGDLIHLRYLGLEQTGVRSLPSSVGKLCNLQILRAPLVPKAVWEIESLRHLVGEAWPSASPHHMKCKNSLQTLDGVRGGRWVGSTLGELTDLRRLWIQGISKSDVPGLSDSLAKLTRLGTLQLWVVGCAWEDAAPTTSSIILQALSKHDALYDLCLMLSATSSPEFIPRWRTNNNDNVIFSWPPQLTRLALEGTGFRKQEHLAGLEGLPHLRILHLHWDAYAGTELVCSAGGFPQLQELELSGLPDLERWRIEGGAIPRLNRLLIHDCGRLEMLPEGLQHVTTLRQLTLRGMPRKFNNRARNPRKFNNRARNEDGGDWPKVRHIPTLKIEGERF